MKTIITLIICVVCSLETMGQTNIAAGQTNVLIEQNLENWPVGDFLANATYKGLVSRDRDYYSFSQMPKYSGKDYKGPISNYTYNDGKRHDWPEVVTIQLPETSAEELQLSYCDSLKQNDITLCTVPAGSDEVVIANLIPQRTYLFSITSTSGDTIVGGRIHTLGHLRMIRLDVGNNVRDMGGWLTASGRRTSYGRIYRGSEIRGGWNTTMTDEDIAELRRIGIGAEIDLRVQSNLPNGPMSGSPLGEDVTLLCLPMKDDINLLIDHKEYYKQAFEFLLENFRNDIPVYVHCSYGADRAGTLCAMIECLCGVDMGDVYKDYELSSMAEEMTARYYFVMNQRIIRQLGIKTSDDVQPMVRNYFIEDVGLTEAQLDEFIGYMVEQEPNTDADGDENDCPTGIISVREAAAGAHCSSPRATYSLDGLRTFAPRHGLYIVKDGNGNIRKITK